MLGYLVRVVMLAVSVAMFVPFLWVNFGAGKTTAGKAAAAAAALLAVAGAVGLGLMVFDTKPSTCGKCGAFPSPFQGSVGTALRLFFDLELLLIATITLLAYCEEGIHDDGTCATVVMAASAAFVAAVSYFAEFVECNACNCRRATLFGVELAATCSTL